MSAPANVVSNLPEAQVAGSMQTVSMHVVRVLLDALVRAGVSRERLLPALGSHAAQLEQQDARLPHAEALRIAEQGIELAGQPAFGLQWAESLSVDTFSPMTYLVAHATNLGEGLEALTQFSRLLSDQTHVAVERHGHEVRLIYRTQRQVSAVLQRVMAELAVFSFVRILHLFCPSFRSERVCFEYAAPSYADAYARSFDSAPCFEQPFTGVAFDSALLTATCAYRDPSVHEAVRALAERRISMLDHMYGQRVRELLVQRRRIGGPAMIEVANKLQLSVHALRRRLAAEGTTFAAIEQEAFALLVKQLLLDQQRSIQEVAFELGFSGTATFHRAFKRAMGTTPRAYLARQH